MPIHSTSIVPRFGELDPYNHVNHAAYVAYFEAARCVALADIGMALPDLGDRGIQIVVTNLEVKFRAAATARDSLKVYTEVKEMRRVSSIWFHRLVRESDQKRLGESTITLGICDSAGRPTRPPDDLNLALKLLLG